MIEVAFPQAEEAALRESAELAQAMDGKVRLHRLAAPFGSGFPYAILGEHQYLPDDTGCGEGFEIFSNIKVWARDEAGTPHANDQQAALIAAVIRRVVNAKLAIDGYRVVDHSAESLRPLTDPDRLTAGRQVECRYWVEPSA